MKNRRTVIFLTFAFFTSILYLRFKPLNPTVVKVVDGDTVDLSDGRTIRLINLDTPELQTADCFATAAAQIATDLLLNQRVSVETDKNQLDRFGRTLGYVFLLDGTFINQVLLEAGAGEFRLDTQNLSYQDVLIAAAQTGHDTIAGMWRACAPDPSAGCLIKGNHNKLDQPSYVIPESRHYSQTVVNYDHDDRWFCTESDAIKAGFQKARL